MFGGILRNQHSLLEGDVVEFLNHKELGKFLPRLVSLQEVKVFRSYGTGNVLVVLLSWDARVPPTASRGPSGVGPPPKPLAMEVVDLSKHSSGGRGQREGSPEVTSPAPLSSKGSRLGGQCMEALIWAQGAVSASDDHHLGMQVVLELYGFEKDGRAQRKLQGGVKVGGGRDPCSRKHT
eukprot:jgi/Botrbrau1/15048/Bobra.0297s0005.1